MRRQMPDGRYQRVGDGRAKHHGTPAKGGSATKLGGSRAGRRGQRRRPAL